jgi:putative PIN family toxin of toxin-antitoxin system
VPSRITPDSNILISALVFGGNPLRLIEMALGGEVSLFISDAILHETLRVLREKFGFSEERAARAERYISEITARVQPSNKIDAIKEDPDDNKVLECAEAAGCEYIVTGDLDLLRLGKYGEIRIMTVRAFLDLHTR